MCDGFMHPRGKILFDGEDVCGKIFSSQRSKTAEHNVYERSKSYSSEEKENPQKSKKTEEN